MRNHEEEWFFFLVSYILEGTSNYNIKRKDILMNILLVEPNYKNKYPPIGLMKISTYHKRRGDNVHFYKGLMVEEELIKHNFERVYITSLFTFYYKKFVETIKFYKKYLNNDNIYIGGIMVTILEEKIKKETNLNHILTGLLTDSGSLGFDDHINIDELPLDYSILDEIEYEYPAGDNYFSYTTRGCPNSCAFCAVPKLEPKYKITNNIYEQIMRVNREYGEKRNLLLLDNNIFNLSEEELQEVVSDIMRAGFTKEPNFIAPTQYELFIKRYSTRYDKRVVDKTVEFLNAFKKRVLNKEMKEKFIEILNDLNKADDKALFMFENRDIIMQIVMKYKYSVPLKRYVDFNQGLEAARITPSKMSILAQLPLRPVRIAFDHYNQKSIDNYENAVRIASDCGVKEFSNYMLYNYNDRPEELWLRIKVNIDLAQELNINMFSFPMKYMPITETDRSYIGKHWNRKFLQSIQAILLVTKGIVADGEDFFYRAFGENIEEFYKILHMPKDFVIYRSYYEEINLTQEWTSCYDKLDIEQRNELVNILSHPEILNDKVEYKDILDYYKPEYKYTELIIKAKGNEQ